MNNQNPTPRRFCFNCHSELPSGAAICPICGAPANHPQQQFANAQPQRQQQYNSQPQAPMYPQPTYNVPQNQMSTYPQGQMPAQNNRGRRIKCPMCGSKNLQILATTDMSVKTSGGGYSVSKGCLGYICLGGPLGLICGGCGSKTTTSVQTHTSRSWNCQDCGHQFPIIEELEKEIEANRRSQKAGYFLFPMAIFDFLCAFYIASESEDYLYFCIPIFITLGLISLVAGIFLPPWNKNRIQQKEAALQELIRTTVDNDPQFYT